MVQHLLHIQNLVTPEIWYNIRRFRRLISPLGASGSGFGIFLPPPLEKHQHENAIQSLNTRRDGPVAGVVVAHASSFTITSSTSDGATKFIVTRSDTNTAETVNESRIPLLCPCCLEFTHFLTVKTHLTPMNKG